MGCGLTFPVTDEVPILVQPGTNMDSALWGEREDELAQWVSQNFDQAQRGEEPPLVKEFIEATRLVNGIVLDIASGPGGSFCVQIMEDGCTDRLMVMNDLGTSVMLAW